MLTDKKLQLSRKQCSGVLCDFSASAKGHSQQPLRMSQEQPCSGRAAKEGGNKGVKRNLMKSNSRNQYKTQKIEQKEW